jgi:hypothetical protein
MSRPPRQAGTDSARAADSRNARPVYDEYNQRAGRVIVRRQRPDDSDDADDAQVALPPQPPPRPLFWGGGLFGGGDRSDDGN